MVNVTSKSWLVAGLVFTVIFEYLVDVSCSKVAIFPPFKVTDAKFMATIIIQENDSAVLDVLIQALSLENHRTIPILGCCLEEMSSCIRRHRPDLIFVDYRSHLPSGSILLAAIKKISALLPVIALSCDLNISKMASKIGFDGFLCKPFDLDDLLERTNAYLQGGRKRPLALAD